MASRLRHGLDIYTMLIDIIMGLSPLQAENLYSELLARYTRRSRVHLYNQDGQEDKNGKIRLMPLQYKAIRTKYGDTYVKKAFTELTNYINFLEKNIDSNSTYKAKLRKLNTGTHNMLLSTPDGWVFNKCYNYIVDDRPKLNVNPFLIDDLHTAKEYIKLIPKETRDTAMDVQQLIKRFPELACMTEEELQDE